MEKKIAIFLFVLDVIASQHAPALAESIPTTSTTISHTESALLRNASSNSTNSSSFDNGYSTPSNSKPKLGKTFEVVDSQVSSDTEAMSTTNTVVNYSGKKAGSSDATTTIMRPSARNDIPADKMRDDLIANTSDEISKVLNKSERIKYSLNDSSTTQVNASNLTESRMTTSAATEVSTPVDTVTPASTAGSPSTVTKSQSMSALAESSTVTTSKSVEQSTEKAPTSTEKALPSTAETETTTKTSQNSSTINLVTTQIPPSTIREKSFRDDPSKEELLYPREAPVDMMMATKDHTIDNATSTTQEPNRTTTQGNKILAFFRNLFQPSSNTSSNANNETTGSTPGPENNQKNHPKEVSRENATMSRRSINVDESSDEVPVRKEASSVDGEDNTLNSSEELTIGEVDYPALQSTPQKRGPQAIDEARKRLDNIFTHSQSQPEMMPISETNELPSAPSASENEGSIVKLAPSKPNVPSVLYVVGDKSNATITEGTNYMSVKAISA